MEQTRPRFEIGETAILQPPHPSAKAFWGVETVILSRSWGISEDAFGERHTGWSYETDIQAPPPSVEHRHQHLSWVWCEYDLRKKYDAGDDFKTIIKQLKTPLELTELEVTELAYE